MRFRFLILLMATSTLLSSFETLAQEWSFDASGLDGVSHADLDVLNQGGGLPGNYRVEVLVNGKSVDSRDVYFYQQKNAAGELKLQPCLSTVQLSIYGVWVEKFPELSKKMEDQPQSKEQCANLKAIPQFEEEFNFSTQQLNLTVPQAALQPDQEGIAPKEQWNDGIAALLLNYQASSTHTEQRLPNKSQDDSQYVLLEPGVNFGAWRLRSSGTWQKESRQDSHWQTAYTYLERGLYDLKSRLTLGERSTPSDIFDSVPFLGVMLASDESMVPSSQSSFSPVVRGIARTMARVVVTQGGQTVYDATVPPGPFALDGLGGLATLGGDLNVKVLETDGANQTFTVPWQTPAVAVHEGYLMYNVMSGKYHATDSSVPEKAVTQFTAMYGLPWGLTVYGGLQNSWHYRAAAAGIGVSLGRLGSISLDDNYSVGKRRGIDDEKGQAWRLRYSKTFDSTGTDLAISDTQIASTGYNTLADVLNSYGEQYDRPDKQKSRKNFTLSQSLGNYGFINLSENQDSYQDSKENSNSFNIGYNVSIHDISLSLNWVRNHQGQHDTDQIFSLMMNLPLSIFDDHSTYASWQMTKPDKGRSTQQLGLNGQAFDNRLAWNVSQDYRPDEANDRNNSTMQLGWSGSHGSLTGNYSYSPSTRRAGVSAAGGMILSRDGLTFGQSLGDIVGLVEAPGAGGIPVGGLPGVETDYRGYTTVSSLQGYRKNTVSIDPTRLPANADITVTDVSLVPTQGAVIPIPFATHIGQRALVTLLRSGGQAVPFGAVVNTVDQDNGNTGITGDNGVVYLSGLPEEGSLIAKWGRNPNQQCQASYHLSEKNESAGLFLVQTTCL